MTEIRPGCPGSPVMLNQQFREHRAAEVMLKDVFGPAV